MIALHQSVCKSPTPCAIDNSRTVCPISFKLGGYIVFDELMILLIFTSVGQGERSNLFLHVGTTYLAILVQLAMVFLDQELIIFTISFHINEK